MKLAIVGAAGKTGIATTRQALDRGHEVVAICRDPSATRLEEFAEHDGFELVTAAVVSDQAMLTSALAGCDAVVAVLITAYKLRATELVAALAKATQRNGVKRLVFTAGEMTAIREDGETFTLRQRLMTAIVPPLMWITPYSMTDMIASSELVHQQTDWEWTIMRAPTLRDAPAEGYRMCAINDVTSAHSLTRDDYAACMLDSLTNPEHHRRSLTVVGDGE
jgi:putative NADH-flavin reductase